MIEAVGRWSKQQKMVWIAIFCTLDAMAKKGVDYRAPSDKIHPAYVLPKLWQKNRSGFTTGPGQQAATLVSNFGFPFRIPSFNRDDIMINDIP